MVLPAIVRSGVGVILNFLGKAVGSVAEHTLTLIVFVAGLVGWWLMQKVKKGLGLYQTSSGHISVVDISLFMITLRS